MTPCSRPLQETAARSITPTLWFDDNPACATAATQAWYGMHKIVIADLEDAVISV